MHHAISMQLTGFPLGMPRTHGFGYAVSMLFACSGILLLPLWGVRLVKHGACITCLPASKEIRQNCNGLLSPRIVSLQHSDRQACTGCRVVRRGFLTYQPARPVRCLSQGSHIRCAPTGTCSGMYNSSCTVGCCPDGASRSIK